MTSWPTFRCPLVYLDTQATAVRPAQAVKIKEALMDAVDRVSKARIPMSSINKAATTMAGAHEETAHGVCFVGRVLKKVTWGSRDYFLTTVVGHEELTVALVCRAGEYNFKGPYLIGGVVSGPLSGHSQREFSVFMWPAFLVKPGIVYYRENMFGRMVPVSYAPETFYVPIARLKVAADEDKGYIGVR